MTEDPRAKLVDRILVVDTSPAILRYLAWLIREVGGYEVNVATHAAKALGWLTQARVRLVIAEIQPDADGIELLETTTRNLIERPPFILMASLFTDEHIARIEAAGGAETITKPFAPDRLLDAIARSLASASDTLRRPQWSQYATNAVWRDELHDGRVMVVADVGPFRLVAEDEYFVVLGINWSTRGGAASLAEAKVAAVRILRDKLFPMHASEGLDERITMLLARLDELERR